MKYLVTGVDGQLGCDVVKELNKRGYYDILKCTKETLDITNQEKVNSTIKKYRPDVIIHCAAYTNVDGAETDKKTCINTNTHGTGFIANASKRVNAKLIYISTDYVFDGEMNKPYEIDDRIDPINVYGLSKYLGEEEAKKNPKHFIVRTSWVFGINGKNFVKTMLKLSETKTALNVVNDQIGSPTYTKDLARLLVDMSLTEKYGLYQAHNEGYVSWKDFAEAIFETFDISSVKVTGVTSEEYKTVAKRPKDSRMSTKALEENGFKKLPNWQDALKEYKDELTEANNLKKGQKQRSR